MSKKIKLAESLVVVVKGHGESYITQMLVELAKQARQRDIELAYLVEMAALHSRDLDIADQKSEMEKQFTAA